MAMDRGALRAFWDWVLESYNEFTFDGGSKLSAAMAYYVLFVMAPGALLLTSLAASFGSPMDGSFAEALGTVLGDELGQSLYEIVVSGAQARSATSAGIVGLVGLIWALGIFYVNIQAVFNRMWRVAARPGASWRLLLWTRLRRFVVMLAPVAVLALGAFSTAVVSLLEGRLDVPVVQPFADALSSPVAVAAVAWVSFAVLYVFLPDAHVPWRAAVVASLLVSLGWTLGTYLFGRYLSWSPGSGAYGTAGAVFVLLIWLNYSSRLVMVGCKMTKRWTERVEGQVSPMPHAAVIRIEVADT